MNFTPRSRLLLWLLLLTGLAGFMYVFKYLYWGRYFMMFMLWNLFLAWIPLIMTYSILFVRQTPWSHWKKRLTIMGFSLIWLLFYPNIPYLITDLIHLGTNTYLIHTPYQFTFSFISWYEFAAMVLSVWIGIMLGFASLYPLQQLIAKHTHPIVGQGFAFLIALLSGYGIYLGRFPRLNSWDLLLSPRTLYRTVLSSLNVKTLAFSVLIGGMYWIIYFSIYILAHHNRPSIHDSI